MKTLILAATLAAASMCACGVPRSTFDFVMSGATGRVSDTDAVGLVDNTGGLEIHDAEWQLTMRLGSLAETTNPSVPLTIIDKASGRIFSTDNGGTCSVSVYPHDTTNGSVFSGDFKCTGLSDGNGDVVDVTGLEFLTYISDSANNPSTDPPTP
jgi:hypothetical protein